MPSRRRTMPSVRPLCVCALALVASAVSSPTGATEPVPDEPVPPTEPETAPVREGWWRDEDGNLFQVAFDMHRRFWLGGGWLGGLTSADDHRLVLESGFRLDVLADDLRTRVRYRFLESELALSPLSLSARLLAIDTSTESDEPFVRITTFVGTPRRHDLYLSAGWWAELLAVEHRPRGSADDTLLRFAGAGFTWDLWHDADMTSYFRLRAGVALDDILRRGDDARFAVTPLVALEADLTFDPEGFHNLVLSTGYEALLFEGPDDGDIDHHTRFVSSVAYELILIALNDQPLTLRVALSGGYRDDLSDPDRDGWALSAMAGLRFSLWAPAPDFAARREAEAQRAGRQP